MSKSFDAIIVGAGPAGCACATWLKQLGLLPVLIDRHARCGGLQLQSTYMNTWIPTSPPSSGEEIAAIMHQNVVALNIDRHLGSTALSAMTTAQGFQVDVLEKNTRHTLLSRYLVLAGGVIAKAGGFSEAPGVIIGATARLTATNFSGKSVAILGGGDNAFENYSFIKDAGASAITLFARTIRARRQMVERVPTEFVRTGAFDADQDKMTVNGQTFDYFVVMFGYEVSQTSLLGLSPQLKPDGYILTDPECRTSVNGVFAIGEMTKRAHPSCLTAMADGVVAAKAIEKLIEK